MPQNSKNIRNVLVITASVIIIILVFMLEKTYTVSTWAKVLPQKQWLLIRGTDGALISQVRNNKNTLEEEYSVLQISRGEETRYVFDQKFAETREVQQGDTVGILYSSADEIRYAELQGELQQAKASLNVMQKGEKTEIIKAAEESLNFARAKANRQKLLLDRLATLHENNLVSQEEYELAEAKMDQLNFEVNIASSELDVVKSGVKTEEIKLAESRITSLQNEMEILEKKIKSYTLTSPLSGRISNNYGGDTLAVVSDERELVLLVPFALDACPYFNDELTLDFLDLNLSYQGESLRAELARDVRILNGVQVRIARIIISEPSEKLLSGMLAACEISGEKVPLVEYIWKNLN